MCLNEALYHSLLHTATTFFIILYGCEWMNWTCCINDSHSTAETFALQRTNSLQKIIYLTMSGVACKLHRIYLRNSACCLVICLIGLSGRETDKIPMLHLCHLLPLYNYMIEDLTNKKPSSQPSIRATFPTNVIFFLIMHRVSLLKEYSWKLNYSPLKNVKFY